MIEKIKVRYEGHAETEIEFSPGLSVLFGANDGGKSALNRAINWTANNSPRGDSMVPWLGKQEAYSTITKDGIEITRTKSGKRNGYSVGPDSYDVVGSSVPEEVSQALNLGEINIQRQVDQYYLLQATAGEVAKPGIGQGDQADQGTDQRQREGCQGSEAGDQDPEGIPRQPLRADRRGRGSAGDDL